MNKEVRSVSGFLKKYGKNYDYDKYERIVAYFYGESCRESIEIQQIKYAIGDLEPNVYEIVVNTLESIFDIECNILDIASGCYPAFAYEIAKRQLELGYGKITCFEPNLVCDELLYQNVSFEKQFFNSKIDLSQYDLITSFLPCYATKEVVKAAIMQQKPFFILPCSCHFIPKQENGYDYLKINNMFDYAYYLMHKYSKQCGIEKIDRELINTSALSQKMYLYRK